MNLTYHTLVGVTTSTVISNNNHNINIKNIWIPILLNILLHGLMDIIPHNYPLSLFIDCVFTSILILLVLIFFNKRKYKITLICVFGAIIPDIIDKLIIKYLLHSNNYLFIFHKSKFINRFYGMYLKMISGQYFWVLNITNIIIVIICFIILNKYKKNFFKFYYTNDLERERISSPQKLK
ncbi:hypothetical protein [Hathewaya massiliensis]|uniref:hypothetical protein n=1 Tax=Hathewaya massiliensis TaxID=1964382 RepID=UPI001159D487|nr:hypothetical protein [Hathewaya massiliensis]